MADVSGSLRGVVVNGIQYRVPGDADVTIKFSPYEKEGIATSGGTIYKMTLMSPNAEGVPVSVNSDEVETLKEVAKQTTDVDISITLADGTEWKCQGQISMGDYSTADGKVELILIPTNAISGWDKF